MSKRKVATREADGIDFRCGVIVSVLDDDRMQIARTPGLSVHEAIEALSCAVVLLAESLVEPASGARH